MKQNPLISTLSVAGTALAISAVMLCVLIVQLQMVSYQSLPQVDSFFNMYEGLVGPFSVVMMMKDAGDCEAVRAEMLRAADRMNASLERYNISFFQAPYRNIDLVMTDYDTWVDKIDAPGWMLKRGGLVLLLLLPALNMVGISLTAFSQA